MRIGEWETHPASNVFPLLKGTDFATLCEDIRAHGLRDPIVRVRSNGQSLVLDGRNRLRACIETGVRPQFRDYKGKDDFEFVWSTNKERRHLEPGRIVALRLDWEELRDKWRKVKQQRKRTGDKSRSDTQKGKAKRATSGTRLSPTFEQEKDREARKARSQLAKAAGVGVATAQKAITVRQEDPDLHSAVCEGDLTLNRAYRQVTQAKAIGRIEAEPQPLPTGRFRVVVVDPPWQYEKRKEDGTQRGKTPYPTMTVEEICRLPVQQHAEKNSILWLWTTNAHLPNAFEVAEAWGFTYKTLLTWAKPKMGLGDWLRGKTEHCLMCVRGKPVVKLKNQTTLLEAPTREHSRKPEEFYRVVEKLCPGSKMEMFARSQRKGWTTWGAEEKKFNGHRKRA